MCDKFQFIFSMIYNSFCPVYRKMAFGNSIYKPVLYSNYIKKMFFLFSWVDNSL